MNQLSVVFDLASLFLAISVVVGRLVRYRRLRIDHVLLFSIGHPYYFSLSSLLAHRRVLAVPFARPFATFAEVEPSLRAWASAWALLALLAFLAGSSLVRVGTAVAKPARWARRANAVVPATVIACVLLGVFLVSCIVYRRVLLEGYSSADPVAIQAQGGRGTLTALAIAAAIACLYACHLHRCLVQNPARRRAATLALAGGVALPILLLPIGGNRLYSLTLLLVLVTWTSNFVRPIARSTLVMVAAAALVLLAMLGSIRIRQAPSANTFLYYTVAESAYGGWSRDLFLTSPRPVLEPVRFPKYLVSDFVNAVPRAFLPQKDALRIDPESDGFRVTSTLGGVHLTTSAWANFGYLGSLAALGGAAAGLRLLQARALQRPWSSLAVTYSILTAALGISFFRDPFGISIVRWGVVTGTVTVAALHLTSRLGGAVLRPLGVVHSARRGRAPAPAAADSLTRPG